MTLLLALALDAVDAALGLRIADAVGRADFECPRDEVQKDISAEGDGWRQGSLLYLKVRRGKHRNPFVRLQSGDYPIVFIKSATGTRCSVPFPIVLQAT